MTTIAPNPSARFPLARWPCYLVEDRGAWNAWVAEAPGNVLQAYEWGELKARFGWESVRLAVPGRGRIVAGAQVLFRRLPVGTFAYVPRGPLVDYADAAALDSLLAGLHALARQRGAFCLKIEPDQPGTPELAARLERLGFRPAPGVQPRSTLVVDLSGGPAAVWRRASARVRYNVRLAARRGVRVAEGGVEDLPTFYRLLLQTSRRAGFAVHGPEYYSALWEELGPRRLARLLIARHEGEPLAAALVLALGEVAYHVYAASAGEGRHLKPNDLLQWEAIRRAQAEGRAAYDLWGIPDEVGRAVEVGQEAAEPGTGGLWGAYQFKRGFGGKVVRYAGAYDWVYSPARYWLWRTFQARAQHLGARARRWVRAEGSGG